MRLPTKSGVHILGETQISANALAPFKKILESSLPAVGGQCMSVGDKVNEAVCDCEDGWGKDDCR